MKKALIKLILTIKNDLSLTIKKLVLIANFLAICLLVGYISKFIPPLPVFPIYLKLNFVDLFIILAFPFLGFFYTYLLIILIPWLLMLISNQDGAIGYLALMLASLSFYTFFLFIQLPLFFLVHSDKITIKNKIKKILTITIWTISIFLAAVANSFWMTFLNWSFILDLYQMGSLKQDLLPLLLAFNLIKFGLVALTYSLIVSATWLLIEKYVGGNYYILL